MLSGLKRFLGLLMRLLAAMLAAMLLLLLCLMSLLARVEAPRLPQGNTADKITLREICLLISAEKAICLMRFICDSAAGSGIPEDMALIYANCFGLTLFWPWSQHTMTHMPSQDTCQARQRQRQSISLKLHLLWCPP